MKDKENYDLLKIPDHVVINSLREEIKFLEKTLENKRVIIRDLEQKNQRFNKLKQAIKDCAGMTHYQNIMSRFEQLNRKL